MNDVYVRKMASIQEVNGVYPIEGADKICQYGINGWRVVDQVGKYQVGDRVIFCEVDSFIPSTIAPFLTKAGHFPKVYNGVEGEKLRTIRLRKALSQGLLLPLSVIPGSTAVGGEEVGDDVSEVLGIQKWEAPPEFTSADARGSFPSFGPKSDQERIQNCYGNVAQFFSQVTWSMSEKVEGQSHCAYHYHGEFGVCSRNINLKDSDNTYWNLARKYGLDVKLPATGKNLMVYSEQVGPGIQGNIYELTEHMLFLYDVFDIDTQTYYSPEKMIEFAREHDLTTVPILRHSCDLGNMTLEEILKMADGKSVLGTTDTLREGLVFKANLKDRISWKAVSNVYLLKN